MSSLKDVQKRTVFKPLLDNPYTDSKFPEIEPSVQSNIVDFLLHILKDYQTYNELISSNGSKLQGLIRPDIMDVLICGFNSVVKKLEQQIRSPSRDDADTVDEGDDIQYVFVCKNDIKPTMLTSHFPNLCYLAKNSKPDKTLKLIMLPKWTMTKLSEQVGFKFGIFAITKSDGLPSEFLKVLNDVKDVEVDWLKHSSSLKRITPFKKAKVKILKTSAIIKPKPQKNKKSN